MNDAGSKGIGAKINPHRNWRLTFPFLLTDKIVGEQESPALLSFMTGISLQRIQKKAGRFTENADKGMIRNRL